MAGIVPGLDRHPLKKLGADEDALLLDRLDCCSAGATRRSKAGRSDLRGLPLPLTPAGMVFGSRVG